MESDDIIRNNVTLSVDLSIHALRMESDQIIAKAGVKYRLSIHALRMESDAFSSQTTTSYAPFYPRSPHGERRDRHSNRTVYGRAFYPRSPHGERHADANISRTDQILSIHALRMESDVWAVPALCGVSSLSIHALRMESDSVLDCFHKASIDFLSTLSAWRATWGSFNKLSCKIFLSTLSAWRATLEALLLGTTPTLSIHALRMESDILHGNFHFYRTAFYPRSPHGERRCAAPTHRQYHPLSIHALRMESDFSCFLYSTEDQPFYPRSPHGERPKC